MRNRTPSVFLIALAVIEEAATLDQTISLAKLHCLLYYVQGHHLAMTNECAFKATIIAAESGPRIPVLDRYVNRYLPELKDGEYSARELLNNLYNRWKNNQ